jgi:hypothetical protein
VVVRLQIFSTWEVRGIDIDIDDEEFLIASAESLAFRRIAPALAVLRDNLGQPVRKACPSDPD